MQAGATAKHLTVNASSGELQVVGELAVKLLVEQGDPFASTDGAGVVLEFNYLSGLRIW
jgi:hypothetical protein